VKSFGYTRNDDWLNVSNPIFIGDAVAVEGADDAAIARMEFTVFVSAEKYRTSNSIDSLELQVVAKSRMGMIYEVCHSEKLSSDEIEVSIDISRYRSLPDLTFEVSTLANLAREVESYLPGRPAFDKSILGQKQISLSNRGVGAQYPNIHIREFPKSAENSIWLVEIEWGLLSMAGIDELINIDVSRVMALQINSNYVDKYNEDIQLQILSIFELARRSIEWFFTMQIEEQSVILGFLARRGNLEGSWLQWIRWCFRLAFGTVFLEANKANLGLVTLKWNSERESLEAQLRSNIAAKV
jgi:hypothetical protein